jgi:hypothetical protein
MRLDKASDVDKISKDDLSQLLQSVWKHTLGRWEEHPSYNGLPFLSIFGVHYSLTTLDIIENKGVDIATIRGRISIDASIAVELLKKWESLGWIESLDDELGDYKVIKIS